MFPALVIMGVSGGLAQAPMFAAAGTLPAGARHHRQRGAEHEPSDRQRGRRRPAHRPDLGRRPGPRLWTTRGCCRPRPVYSPRSACSPSAAAPGRRRRRPPAPSLPPRSARPFPPSPRRTAPPTKERREMTFSELHHRDRPLILPNAWDVLLRPGLPRRRVPGHRHDQLRRRRRPRASGRRPHHQGGERGPGPGARGAAVSRQRGHRGRLLRRPAEVAAYVAGLGPAGSTSRTAPAGRSSPPEVHAAKVAASRS